MEGRGWTRVDELEMGDAVVSSSGAPVTVVGLRWTGEVETVYNFGVDELRSYFVGELGAWVHNCKITVIGRMDDLKQFDNKVNFDTWRKTGRGTTWRDNREWLQARIDRGDKFGIAMDPATLPSTTINNWKPGEGSGFFTALELRYLLKNGIKPMKMF